MRISVDNSHCEAQAQCAAVNPDLFTLDEDGYSDIGQDKDVPVGLEEDARDGVASCPMVALSLTE